MYRNTFSCVLTIYVAIIMKNFFNNIILIIFRLVYNFIILLYYIYVFIF